MYRVLVSVSVGMERSFILRTVAALFSGAGSFCPSSVGCAAVHVSRMHVEVESVRHDLVAVANATTSCFRDLPVGSKQRHTCFGTHWLEQVAEPIGLAAHCNICLHENWTQCSLCRPPVEIVFPMKVLFIMSWLNAADSQESCTCRFELGAKMSLALVGLAIYWSSLSCIFD